MSQPQPISDSLIAEFNTLRSDGRVLDMNIKTAQIKKRIEALSKSDPRAYKAILSAFYGLTGKWDDMQSQGLAAVRAYGDDIIRLFYTTTLLNTGFFSKAAETLARVDWTSPDQASMKFDYADTCCLFGHMLAYTDVCNRSNISIPEQVNMQMVQAAHDILSANNIEESTVTSMLDIAGEMLRERGMLRHIDATATPYPSDGTVTILQPIKATAAQVAEMDWEYGMRLFQRMPDAPATVVHIGFKMAQEA